MLGSGLVLARPTPSCAVGCRYMAQIGKENDSKDVVADQSARFRKNACNEIMNIVEEAKDHGQRCVHERRAMTVLRQTLFNDVRNSAAAQGVGWTLGGHVSVQKLQGLSRARRLSGDRVSR